MIECFLCFKIGFFFGNNSNDWALARTRSAGEVPSFVPIFNGVTVLRVLLRTYIYIHTYIHWVFNKDIKKVGKQTYLSCAIFVRNDDTVTVRAHLRLLILYSLNTFYFAHRAPLDSHVIVHRSPRCPPLVFDTAKYVDATSPQIDALEGALVMSFHVDQKLNDDVEQVISILQMEDKGQWTIITRGNLKNYRFKGRT